MHSPLFTILNRFDDKFPISDGAQYKLDKKISAQSGEPFVLLKLAASRELEVLAGKFVAVDEHLTFFKNQDKREGYLSAYHYTAVFQTDLGGPKPQSVVVRVFVNRFDMLSCKATVWAYDPEKKERGARLPDFFTDVEEELFSSNTFGKIGHIIRGLRETQEKIVVDLSKKYQKLSTKIANWNRDPVFRENNQTKYIQGVDQCVAVLSDLCECSDQYDYYEALTALFARYKEKASEKSVSVVHSQSDITHLVKEEPQTALYNDNPQKENELVAKLKVVNEILDSCHAYDIPPAGQQEALQLESQLQVLEEVFQYKRIQELNVDEIQLFQVIMKIRDLLGAYCLSQMTEGNGELAEHFYPYMLSDLSDVLRRAVDRDDAELIDSLLNSGKVSIHSLLDDGWSIGSSIFIGKKKRCLEMLLKRNVSFMEVYSQYVLKIYRSSSVGKKQLSNFFDYMGCFSMVAIQLFPYELFLNIHRNNVSYVENLTPDMFLLKNTSKKNSAANRNKKKELSDLLDLSSAVLKLMLFGFESMGREGFAFLKGQGRNNSDDGDNTGLAESLSAFRLEDVLAFKCFFVEISLQLDNMGSEPKQLLKRLVSDFFKELGQHANSDKGVVESIAMIGSFVNFLMAAKRFFVVTESMESELYDAVAASLHGPNFLKLCEVFYARTDPNIVEQVGSLVECPGSLFGCAPPPGSYMNQNGNTVVPL